VKSGAEYVDSEGGCERMLQTVQIEGLSASTWHAYKVVFIIIIIINCSWAVTQWQWLSHVTKKLFLLNSVKHNILLGSTNLMFVYNALQ
jgi:hypothetical protein